MVMFMAVRYGLLLDLQMHLLDALRNGSREGSQ